MNNEIIIKKILSNFKSHYTNTDPNLILQAYKLAKNQHKNQKRDSGEPYIIHPLEVALILSELGTSIETIIAGLLHDVVEDTNYSLEKIKKQFGKKVAFLVDGVTNLREIEYGKNAKAETVRKLVVAMSKDIRVLVIKIADRLNNMRTIFATRKEKQIRKATETLDIYAPLANRLGLGKIKVELEDQSFKVLMPKIYDEIDKFVKKKAPERNKKIILMKKELAKGLKEINVKGEIKAREKEYYSIYLKTSKRNVTFDEIYDLVGVRILVDSIPDCYAVLGLIHGIWLPVPGRFKDYIAKPKINMYQSLHTTVIGPNKQSVEIQIRTYEMNERAELGIAAHWKYKDSFNSKNKGRKRIINAEKVKEHEILWAKNLAQWQKSQENSSDFLEELKFQIKSEEIFIYTPAGDIITLPQNSVPIDLAYAIHSKVGDTTVGARVNGKMVQLSQILNTGDTVEIITGSNESKPNSDWLKIVQSPKAKQKIKASLRKEQKSDSLEIGKRKLNDEIKKRKLLSGAFIGKSDVFQKVADEFGFDTMDKLFTSVGENYISPENVISKYILLIAPEIEEDKKNNEDNLEISKNINNDDEQGILVDGQKGLLVKFALCCTPVPGDKIIGFLTHTQGVSIHNINCKNAKHLLESRKERVVDAQWTLKQSGNYSAKLTIETISKSGLLSDISSIFKEKKVDIASFNSRETKDKMNIIDLKIIVSGPRLILEIINGLKKIDGVYDVHRLTT